MRGADNTDALLNARRRVSAAKREAVFEALRSMLADGSPITFCAVAKRAQVSEGLVHKPPLKTWISDAVQEQASGSGLPRPTDSRVITKVTAASLQQDLEIARAALRDAREESKVLRARLQRDLGSQLDARATEGSLTRIDDLEQRNRALLAQLDQLSAECADFQDQLSQTVEDLQSSRVAHARLMRQVNAKSQDKPAGQ